MSVVDQHLRIKAAIERMSLPAPELGELNEVAYEKVANAVEWMQKRIRGLEWQIRDLCYEPRDGLDFPPKAIS